MKFPRPQLHLATCIALMLIAGTILMANVLPSLEYSRVYNFSNYTQGWPFVFCYSNVVYGRYPAPAQFQFGKIIVVRLLADIAIVFLILATVAFACEYLLRRRRKI